MDLFSEPVLLVEQAGGFRKALVNTAYAADVYDQRGNLLARVRERRRPGPLGLLRVTELTGSTPFDLAVTLPDGREVLGIAKGFHLLAGRVTVTGPDGRVVGTMIRKLMRPITFADPDGNPLGTFADAAGFRHGDLDRRDGRKVRRDTLWPHPHTTGPVRTLAIAAGLAYGVVSNTGTD
ncbi:hypothetical protein [Actinokineospora sp. NPDC004072]